jgi:trimethylamine--corrinoid protein Co-methyltransferase
MIKALRPLYKPLSEPLLKKILAESYELLEKYGMFVENKEAMNLFKQAGAQINEQENREACKEALML